MIKGTLTSTNPNWISNSEYWELAKAHRKRARVVKDASSICNDDIIGRLLAQLTSDLELAVRHAERADELQGKTTGKDPGQVVFGMDE